VQKEILTAEKQTPARLDEGLAAPAPPSVVHKHFEAPHNQPRNFFKNHFVYTVISQRAHGLAIGINMNPDKRCNFDCLYCEVNRDEPARYAQVDLKAMSAELESLLSLAFEKRLRDLSSFRHLPRELLELKAVILSGDGEPTLCPNFAEIVREIVHIRSKGKFPFFKIVLNTNTTGLSLPEVRRGLHPLTQQDEIWVKLEAGTQEYMDKVNHGDIPLRKVLANILLIGRERPIVIQSLFPLINDEEPPAGEIEQYVQRLQELKAGGAQISMVQVFSAHRPPHRPVCGHLPLKTLSLIARRVREVTGLRAEVF